jgi:hypothetical protein
MNRFAAGARAALEEARELRPSASEVDLLHARIAKIPAVPSPSRLGVTRARTISAVALLLFGVSLITGLDYMRSSASQVQVTALRHTPALPPSTPEPAQPMPVSAPAAEVIATQPPRIVEPLGTSGVVEHARAGDVSMPVLQPGPLVPELLPPGEVSDYFVSPPAPVDVMPRPSRVIPLPPITASSRTVSPSAAAPVSYSAASVPAPAAVIPPPPAAGEPDDRRITEVLNAYARAYGQLDTGAARHVWPSVNERALARAFADLSSQDIAFENCQLDVRGTTASAVCHGRASYVGKVGSREPRTENRQWRFELRRDGEEWKIAAVDSRR